MSLAVGAVFNSYPDGSTALVLDSKRGDNNRRFSPPPRPDEWIARPALQSQLAAAIDRHRLSVLCAPPGYGKTALLAAHCRQEHRRVVWLSLHPSHRGPAALVRALAGAIKRATRSSGIAEPPLSWPGTTTTDPVRSVLTIIERLTMPPTATLFVLDGLQVVQDSPAALSRLGRLVSRSPAYIRYVVTTHAAGVLTHLRLPEPARVAWLARDQLRFDQTELEDALSRMALAPDAWPSILRPALRAEGWPVVVGMALRARRDASVESAPDPQAVFDALATQLFAALPEPEARLLWQIAHLERITPDLCATCLGAPDAQRRLDRLKRDVLFLEKVGANHYRLHGLFRRFLLEQDPPPCTAFGPEQHRCAARWCRTADDPVAELRHLVAAEAPDEAERRIAELAPELARAGRWHALQTVIHQHGIAHDDPPNTSLVRWLARAQLNLGQNDAALATLTDAITHTTAPADLARLHLSRSYANWRQGALENAIDDANRTLRHNTALSPTERVKALRALGGTHADNLDWSRTGEAFARAEQVIAQHPDVRNRALLLADIAMYERIRGALDRAAATAKRALTVSDAQALIEGQVRARYQLMVIQRWQGQPRVALDTIRQALPLARKADYTYLEALVHLGRGELRADLGQRDEAELYYKRCHVLAEEIDDRPLIVAALTGQARLHHRRGNLAASRRLLDSAERALTPGMRHDRMVLRIDLAAQNIAEGRIAIARDQLATAVAALAAGDARSELARAQLHYAHLQLLQDGLAAALAVLEPLAEQIEEMAAPALLAADARLMPRLWDALAAAECDQLRVLAGTAAETKRQPAQALPPTARHDDPSPELLSAREREIVIGLCEGLSRNEIAARLDLSRSTIDKAISALNRSIDLGKAYQVVAWAHRVGLYPPRPAPPSSEPA